MEKFYLFICLLISCSNSDLRNKNPTEFFFGEVVSNDINIGKQLSKSFSNETRHDVKASYLGNIKEENGSIYKVLVAIHFTGILDDAVRARAEIRMYSQENELIGKYNVGGVDRVPVNISDYRYLEFYPSEKCPESTKVDFSSGPPDKIFINCTKKGGDVFNLKKM